MAEMGQAPKGGGVGRSPLRVGHLRSRGGRRPSSSRRGSARTCSGNPEAVGCDSRRDGRDRGRPPRPPQFAGAQQKREVFRLLRRGVRPRVRWQRPHAHAILGRMGKLDYYAVLGLGRDATTEEVKAVYRQLARAFHPDANADAAKAEDFAAAEHFKKITEAYTVLSDPEKRALYDHWGESWREAKKKGRRWPAPPRARLVPTSQPRRKRRLQDDLLEHTARRLDVSVAGIELIGVGMTVDVRTRLLDEEEASDGTHAQ